MIPACPSSSIAVPRVSTLELFFDLVFVFTITQLTSVLVAGGDAAAAVQVVVMLAVIWWMYDGYAWLTNAIATDLPALPARADRRHGRVPRSSRSRSPRRTRATDSRSGSATSRSCSCTAAMYAKGTSVSEVAAILRIVPYNLTAAGLVVLGGALGGDAQWVLWTGAAVLIWVHAVAHRHEGFSSRGRTSSSGTASSSSSRSASPIVVIGVGAAGLPLDLDLVAGRAARDSP